MRFNSVCILLLLVKTTVSAQSVAPDTQLTQFMLTEIRQLRQDLQTAASTIQRVQIAMYRLQVQGGQLDRVTQRVEQTRSECMGTQAQRRNISEEIERIESMRRNAQNTSDQKVAEGHLSRLRSTAEDSANRERQCQIDQADVENQFRTEQAKMNDLQDQLDRLDKTLAGYSKK